MLPSPTKTVTHNLWSTQSKKQQQNLINLQNQQNQNIKHRTAAGFESCCFLIQFTIHPCKFWSEQKAEKSWNNQWNSVVHSLTATTSLKDLWSSCQILPGISYMTSYIFHFSSKDFTMLTKGFNPTTMPGTKQTELQFFWKSPQFIHIWSSD